MAYLLDANVFMQAKNLHYGLDFCPAFWEWLIARNAVRKVVSIEKVGDEIAAGNDDLSIWAAARGDGFFLKPDTTMLPALTRVSSWAVNQNYDQAAVNTFLMVADYYLVAHALAHRHIIVTHEIASTSTKKIKIPDTCIASVSNVLRPSICCGKNAHGSYWEHNRANKYKMTDEQ